MAVVVPLPGIDENGRLYLEQMPPEVVTGDEMNAAITAAMQNVGATQPILDAIQVVNNRAQLSPIIWNTTVGGIPESQGGVRDDVNGVYPPHPITKSVVIFNNPDVKPTSDGNATTGTGGLVRGVDMWVGPA